jgi:Zinc carboxypeptidase
MSCVIRALPIAALAALTAGAWAQPLLVGAPASGEQMRFDPSGSSVVAGSDWDITIRMQDDNENPSLGSTFRRWWHLQIENLTPGETLNIDITHSGYDTIILPTWSLSTDGVNFGDHSRLPVSATPVRTGPSGDWTHSFSVQVPPGVVAIRLAKWFPYTPTMFSDYRTTVLTGPRITESVIGTSALGRPIRMWTITDSSVPDTSKHRVWIHTCVHPAENTAYYTIEGLVSWLTSGQSEPELLLDSVILHIIPVANPDGQWLGNYRTNSNSVNLEIQWTAPYTTTTEEVAAMIAQIEGFMGTAALPGSNPIEIILNLHSAHGSGYPFHFVHDATPGWTYPDPGVIPEVNALELSWVSAFRNRSPFVNISSDSSSTAGAPSRPYVESMMHDRWSSDPAWTGPKVMAITLEGTYAMGPDTVTWGTDDDYRLMGEEMGFAIADFLGIAVPAELTGFSMR